MSSILVIDDDEHVRRFLRTILASHGHAVLEASTAAAGIAAVAGADPELVLLDLGLPDGDGLAVLHAIRPTSRVPVIILSARGQEGDKVVALDSGADDYLTKPFGAGELLARIRAALRKVAGGGAPEPDVMIVGPIRVDVARREVTVEGREVRLTPIELALLAELARQPGRVLTHRHLLRAAWGPGAAEQSHTLRVHVAALRRKLERDPAQPRWLLTEVGVGYRLREPPR